MFPGTHARRTPDKPAAVMAGSGESLTYRQLEENSARLARHLHGLGLRRGDTPRSFAFVERLPRTATGKLAKHRLMRNQPDATGASVEFTARSAPAPGHPTGTGASAPRCCPGHLHRPG